jgi:hypothetical protein
MLTCLTDRCAGCADHECVWFRIGYVCYSVSGISRVHRTVRSVERASTNFLSESSGLITAAALSKPAVLLLHFFGIALMRICPALNAAGVDFPSAIRIVVRTPVTGCARVLLRAR